MPLATAFWTVHIVKKSHTTGGICILVVCPPGCWAQPWPLVDSDCQCFLASLHLLNLKDFAGLERSTRFSWSPVSHLGRFPKWQ